MSLDSQPQTQDRALASRVMHVVLSMDFGGTEQVIRQIILGVDPERFWSSVICIDGHVGEIGQQLQSEGTSIHTLSRRPGLDWRTIQRLRRLIQEQQIDVLHCHQYTPFCYGALACVGLSTKVIFTEHGRFYPDRFTWKRRLVNQLLFRLADRITCISKATRKALDEYEWIPERKVDVIYNGVKKPALKNAAGSVRQALGLDDDTYVLGTISRLDPIKNQSMMIQALTDLRESIDNCVLILAGDGPERQSLEELAASNGVAQSVYFTGFVTDIGDYLDAIDVFLLTSYSEGTSMTLLEAMSMSKPIIATSVGGNSEVLSAPDTGVLIASGDQKALVRALKDVHDDSDLRNRLSSGAQACFQELFSRETMSRAYSQLYEALLAYRWNA